jgi:hypothetical protein
MTYVDEKLYVGEGPYVDRMLKKPFMLEESSYSCLKA